MLRLTSAGENGGTKFFLSGDELEPTMFKSPRKVAQFIVDELPETANQILSDYRSTGCSEAIEILINDSAGFIHELEAAYVKEYDEIFASNPEE